MRAAKEGLPIVLRVNGMEHALDDIDELRQKLHKVQQADFADVWLERRNVVMSMLTNRDRNRAFQMYLTADNPAGFHAISDSETDRDEEIKFLLDNGQADEFEFSDTIVLADAIRALEYFFLHGGKAPFILWRDDSP